MRVYNELLFNNLKGFLDSCFPVARRLLGDKRWTRLAREFFAAHRCTAPLFRQIPEEFVRWVAAREDGMSLPDYLPHLAHYEWVELALDVMPRDPVVPGTLADGDLLSGRPVLNPVSFLLVYPYAVQRIREDYRPKPNQAEPTCILAFRDGEDRVRFIVLNPVAGRLLELLQSGRLTGRGALRRIAAELQHPDPAVVIEGGRAILENLRREGAVLGIRPGGRAVP
jgi:hypothetical protein